MPEIVTCPHCQKRLRLPEGVGRLNVRCPSCREIFSPEQTPPTEEVVSIQPEPDPRPSYNPLARFEPEAPLAESGTPLTNFRKSRKAPSKSRLWVVALTLLAVVGGVIAWYFSRASSRAIVRENSAQRRQDIREALVEQKPLTEKEIAAELAPLFDELGAAFRAEDGDRAAATFDVDRLFAELESHGPLPRELLQNKRRFLAGAKIGLARGFEQQAPLIAWDTYEIRHIKKLSDTDVVVIAKHKATNGYVVKMRWWASRESGPWKFYDMEDLDVNLRATSEMHVVVNTMNPQDPDRIREVQRATHLAREAGVALTAGQVDLAEQKIQQLRLLRLPRLFKMIERLFSGSIHLARGEPEKALECFDQAEAFNPDMPGLHFLRGSAYNQLGQWDRALDRLGAYRDLLGEDDLVCLQMGESLRGLERFGEAARQYRTSLDHQPNNPDALLGLLLSLTANDNHDDVEKRFAGLQDRGVVFDYLIGELLASDHYHSVEHLARAMRKLDPNHPGSCYYLALARARARDGKQATDYFRQWLTRETNARERERLLPDLLGAMADGGLAVEAYQSAPDPGQAFNLIAPDLLRRFSVFPLAQLVQLHEKKSPGDPSLPFYRGAILASKGEYDLAQKEFETGTKNPSREVDLELFRQSRVSVLYHLGRSIQALEGIAPRQETFAHLAFLALEDENYRELQTLLDAQAKADPGSAEVLRYSFRMHIRQKNLDRGIELFQQAVRQQQNAQEQQVLRDQFIGDMIAAGAVVRAYEAFSDRETTFLNLAYQLQYRNDPQPLRELIQAHRKHHPESSHAGCFQGLLHVRAEQWNQAVDEFQKALPGLPDADRSRFQAQYVLALYKTGRGIEAYNAIPAGGAFTQLANLFHHDRDAAGLEQLLAAHRRTEPDSATLVFHEAMLRLMRDQVQDAIPLIKKAHEMEQDEEHRASYVGTWTLTMLQLGKGLEGYRSSPDPGTSFQILARDYVYNEKPDELKQLLDEHGKDHAADPGYSLYLAELCLLRNDAGQAEALLEKALRDVPRETNWQLRNALHRARLRLGKIVETYRELENKDRDFFTLAHVCLAEKNARQLEALIAEHVRTHPGDDRVGRWRLEVHWLDRDYEKVVQFIRDNDKKGTSGQDFAYWRNEYLLRSLLRLKRTAEAEQAARDLTRRKDVDWEILILAHGILGDVENALKYARLIIEEDYGDVMTLYQDEDLAPILRGDAFEKFRAKLPPPDPMP